MRLTVTGREYSVAGGVAALRCGWLVCALCMEVNSPCAMGPGVDAPRARFVGTHRMLLRRLGLRNVGPDLTRALDKSRRGYARLPQRERA